MEVITGGKAKYKPQKFTANPGRPSTEDNIALGWWNLFARVKYWAAKARGPRDLLSGKSTRLETLADDFIVILEKAWRSGYKGEDLAKAVLLEIKRREANGKQE